MEFTYEVMNDSRVASAFIDREGDLWVRTDKGVVVFTHKDGVGIVHDRYTLEDRMREWGVERAFYPGDTLTITF